MNAFIINQFQLFLKNEVCFLKDIVGRCYYTCDTFFRYMSKTIVDNYTVNYVTSNNIQILKDDAILAELRIRKCACLYDDMKEFQEQAKELYEMSKSLHDDNHSLEHAPCISLEGRCFIYYKHQVYTNTKKVTFGLGFQHYVIEVETSKDELYVLDPTCHQFKHMPNKLIVSNHNL